MIDRDEQLKHIEKDLEEIFKKVRQYDLLEEKLYKIRQIALDNYEYQSNSSQDPLYLILKVLGENKGV